MENWIKYDMRDGSVSGSAEAVAMFQRHLDAAVALPTVKLEPNVAGAADLGPKPVLRTVHVPRRDRDEASSVGSSPAFWNTGQTSRSPPLQRRRVVDHGRFMAPAHLHAVGMVPGGGTPLAVAPVPNPPALAAGAGAQHMAFSTVSGLTGLSGMLLDSGFVDGDVDAERQLNAAMNGAEFSPVTEHHIEPERVLDPGFGNKGEEQRAKVCTEFCIQSTASVGVELDFTLFATVASSIGLGLGSIAAPGLVLPPVLIPGSTPLLTSGPATASDAVSDAAPTEIPDSSPAPIDILDPVQAEVPVAGSVAGSVAVPAAVPAPAPASILGQISVPTEFPDSSLASPAIPCSAPAQALTEMLASAPASILGPTFTQVVASTLSDVQGPVQSPAPAATSVLCPSPILSSILSPSSTPAPAVAPIAAFEPPLAQAPVRTSSPILVPVSVPVLAAPVQLSLEQAIAGMCEPKSVQPVSVGASNVERLANCLSQRGFAVGGCFDGGVDERVGLVQSVVAKLGGTTRIVTLHVSSAPGQKLRSRFMHAVKTAEQCAQHLADCGSDCLFVADASFSKPEPSYEVEGAKVLRKALPAIIGAGAKVLYLMQSSCDGRTDVDSVVLLLACIGMFPRHKITLRTLRADVDGLVAALAQATGVKLALTLRPATPDQFYRWVACDVWRVLRAYWFAE